MENALILGQTIFYFAVSIAVIAIGILIFLVIYHFMRMIQELEKISRNIRETSDEVKEDIRDVVENLSGLPILSYFLKKRSATHRAKKSSSKK